jgi:hypothetical protein
MSPVGVADFSVFSSIGETTSMFKYFGFYRDSCADFWDVSLPDFSGSFGPDISNGAPEFCFYPSALS